MLRADSPNPQAQVPDGGRRLALVVEYDGTRYSGFQWQSGVPTIQGEIENALERFTGEKVRVRGASRTDGGVHARGQVVDLLTQAFYPVNTFVDALNWRLSPAIRVRGAFQVPLDFNSRRDAGSREYRYTLVNCRWPSALLRDFAHWVRSPMDVGRMTDAAQHLVGAHDFSALTSPLPPGKSALRRVDRWQVWKEGELVLIEAEANAFLPHQVRRTNGILVEIGLGRMCVGMIKGIVDGTIRRVEHCPSLPAKGLCLMRVKYPRLSTRDGQAYETG